MDTQRALSTAKARMWEGILGAIVTLVGRLSGATIWGRSADRHDDRRGDRGIAALVIGSSSEEVHTVAEDVQAVHVAVEDNGDPLAPGGGKLDQPDRLEELEIGDRGHEARRRAGKAGSPDGRPRHPGGDLLDIRKSL